jgi:small subunit ribosomal protein S1
MFSVGDDIRVVILKFDRESGKVSLGLKQLQSDPWQNVEDRYPVGSRVSGKVVSLTDYGAFVSLEDGVEGLIHISEMSWTKKIKHPSKVLTAGDAVEAIVLDVDLESKRISLGLKQIEANPWEKIEDKYPLGTKLKGTVRNIADFGVFIDVGGEIDGLVHISDLSWVQNFAHPSELYKKGDEIEVIVLHIDSENERFSLGVKHLQDDPWDVINSSYREGEKAEGTVAGFSGAGAVIKLSDKVEGLVPLKQYPEDLKVGDSVKIVVRQTDQRDRRFILGIDGSEASVSENG